MTQEQSTLHQNLSETLGSLQLIFGSTPQVELIKKLQLLIAAVAQELTAPLVHNRITQATADSVDSIDLFNASIELTNLENLKKSTLVALANVPLDDFFLLHAQRVVTAPLLLQKYLQLLNVDANNLTRVRKEWSTPLKTTLFPNSLDELTVAIAQFNPFAGGKALRYDNGTFSSVELLASRQLEEFYGYLSVRSLFAEHFNNFAAGRPVAPLFITSLPGLGKTALTISYALANSEITLVLPSPTELQEKLPELLQKLNTYQDRKFVLFFDDIDPREIDWYNFRTHIGGVFATSSNVTLVIAANYDFPPNVLSRGRTVSFPIFDELRCMEMINDYLVNHKLRNPDANLIAVIAADYVEEFGQKKFTELSPRSLVRYLEFYISDANKRKHMLEMSRNELIVRPDAQLFYEQNIKMMRSLYGDGYIEEILQEKLRKLSQS